MPSISLPRVVIDTNVFFERLTKQGGAAGLVTDAWLAELLEVCVSNPLAKESLGLRVITPVELVIQLTLPRS